MLPNIGNELMKRNMIIGGAPTSTPPPPLPTTFGNSETSLAACLQRAPTNAWMAAPESYQPGAPAP